METVKAVNALLPQTQCGDCGYAGCLPYAEALVKGLAPIDRCPPGGIQTLQALGQLLNVDPTPYFDAVEAKKRAPALAVIDESTCIGCTKCIQACPVDAIIGTGKRMHTIIPHECTGCGLCVEPCPVNCIEILPLKEEAYDRSHARKRYEAKQARIVLDSKQKKQLYDKKRQLQPASPATNETQAKQAYIQEAMKRVAEKKRQRLQGQNMRQRDETANG